MLAVEKKSIAKLQEERTVRKICPIDDHVVMAFAGKNLNWKRIEQMNPPRVLSLCETLNSSTSFNHISGSESENACFDCRAQRRCAYTDRHCSGRMSVPSANGRRPGHVGIHNALRRSAETAVHAIERPKTLRYHRSLRGFRSRRHPATLPDGSFRSLSRVEGQRNWPLG